MTPLQIIVAKNLAWRFGVQLPAFTLYALLMKGVKR